MSEKVKPMTKDEFIKKLKDHGDDRGRLVELMRIRSSQRRDDVLSVHTIEDAKAVLQKWREEDEKNYQEVIDNGGIDNVAPSVWFYALHVPPISYARGLQEFIQSGGVQIGFAKSAVKAMHKKVMSLDDPAVISRVFNALRPDEMSVALAIAAAFPVVKL